jgi:phosphate/sulfate permease
MRRAEAPVQSPGRGPHVTTWLITIPACMAMGWALYTLFHLATGLP